MGYEIEALTQNKKPLMSARPGPMRVVCVRQGPRPIPGPQPKPLRAPEPGGCTHMPAWARNERRARALKASPGALPRLGPSRIRVGYRDRSPAWAPGSAGPGAP